MAKNAQPFGSRRGKIGNTVRGNTVKLQQNKMKWLNELGGLLDEARAMPSAATIVVTYHKEHGDKLADPTSANDSYRSLCTVVQNHQEACGKLTERLKELGEELTGKAKLNENIKMLEFAGNIQDVMNDFGMIGMFAIDQCLEPYRELARADSSIPFPGYMTPREGEPSMLEQHPAVAGETSKMTVVDIPSEEQQRAARVADAIQVGEIPVVEAKETDDER